MTFCEIVAQMFLVILASGCCTGIELSSKCGKRYFGLRSALGNSNKFQADTVAGAERQNAFTDKICRQFMVNDYLVVGMSSRIGHARIIQSTLETDGSCPTWM